MKIQNSKGITLIALVITIIVLLLLAGVSIAMLTGENGILIQAMEAGEKTERAESEEKLGLALSEYRMEKHTTEGLDLKTFLQNHEYITKVEGDTAPYTVTVDEYVATVNEDGNYTDTGSTPTPPELPDTSISIIEDIATLEIEIYSETENTILADEYGNKVVIPAGFGISSESGNNVTKGIVIIDPTNLNEFVWVPVGKINNNGTEHTIELGRYQFAADGTATKIADDTALEEIYVDYEELEVSTYGNSAAKDLTTFKTETLNSSGYYIARYESSNNGGIAASKEGVTPWANISQEQASIEAIEMYDSETAFSSDLINSYAWDTALVFIQEFSDTKNYSKQGTTKTGRQNTGAAGDEKLKINDMASNLWELSTETAIDSASCVIRGGHEQSSSIPADTRIFTAQENTGNADYSFRAIIYFEN